MDFSFLMHNKFLRIDNCKKNKQNISAKLAIKYLYRYGHLHK